MTDVESATETRQGVGRSGGIVGGTAGDDPSALHGEIWERLGFSDAPAPPLREALRGSGVGLYPVLALGVLTIMDQLQGYAFTVLTPEMARALGLSVGLIAGLRTLQALTNALSPLPFARLTQSRPRRALLSIVTGFGWSFVAFSNGLVQGVWGLALVLLMDGILGGSVMALHQPLIMDTYPPSARVRTLTIWTAFRVGASLVAPVLVALSVVVFDLTWRGVFLVLGSISAVGTLFSLGIRDPGFGRWDTERVRKSVGMRPNDQGISSDMGGVELGLFEVLKRIWLISTIRRLAAGYLAIGVLIIPFTTYLSFFLEQRWGLDSAGRGWFFASTAGFSATSLLLFGRRAESIFRKDPARIPRMASYALACAVSIIAVAALVPNFWIMALLFAAAQGLVAVLFPLVGIAKLSVVEAKWRPHVSALIGISVAAGSLLGLFLLVGIDRDFGIQGAFVALLIPGLIGAYLIRSVHTLLVPDLRGMVERIMEEEGADQRADASGSSHLLECRNITFSYGRLQVLFDVDFHVDEGEIVALLGTNGAGKSTLLRVISGTRLPSSGAIRFEGREVTYLDAERRVGLGIGQVPGGRAVFNDLSVVENLRGFAYTLRGNRPAIERGIEQSLATFPQLHERRNSRARTLSGGERQMLGLCQAFILQPRLLLIDELSLGLAPVIVQQLLEMVRLINQHGAAVVLVEQSVNVALSLVDHAYFMEKGQIRFDGLGSELLARGDLLRAVFLSSDATLRVQ